MRHVFGPAKGVSCFVSVINFLISFRKSETKAIFGQFHNVINTANSYFPELLDPFFRDSLPKLQKPWPSDFSLTDSQCVNLRPVPNRGEKREIILEMEVIIITGESGRKMRMSGDDCGEISRDIEQ